MKDNLFNQINTKYIHSEVIKSEQFLFDVFECMKTKEGITLSDDKLYKHIYFKDNCLYFWIENRFGYFGIDESIILKFQIVENPNMDFENYQELDITYFKKEYSTNLDLNDETNEFKEINFYDLNHCSFYFNILSTIDEYIWSELDENGFIKNFNSKIETELLFDNLSKLIETK